MFGYKSIKYKFRQDDIPIHTSYLIVAICLFLSCVNKKDQLTKEEEEFSGKIISIIDGDTYELLDNDNKTIRIRMEGIDAPEKGMPYCNVAKKYLSSLCFGKKIRLDGNRKDRNERIIAYSYLEDSTELSHEMVKAGLAWHFKKYSSDSSLANLEIEARNLGLGLWKDKNPTPPWEIRKLHREGISTIDSFNFESEND
ncbi:MAG: thermonuclease family protein [Saprospiraceae bacterium]|nr:thermonuclease family protein [Saprospiraceae bacterium]